MEKKIQKLIKTIHSIADVLSKKINSKMSKICEEKYYCFEPEEDPDYYFLEEIKYGLWIIMEKLEKFKEKLENVK